MDETLLVLLGPLHCIAQISAVYPSHLSPLACKRYQLVDALAEARKDPQGHAPQPVECDIRVKMNMGPPYLSGVGVPGALQCNLH